MINFICGRAKSGKSEYVYNEIKRLSDDGEQVILIVPDQYTHAAEKRLLKKINAIGDGSVEVFSFARLATVTEKRLGFPCTPKIGAVGKALTVDRILKENELKFFKNSNLKNGFSDIVTSSIGEFKKYLITPEILKETAEKSGDEVLSMKLSDLGIIYESYEKKINESYEDSSDSLTIFASRLNENAIYKDKYIFLDGFSTFVPQETEVICALALQAKKVSITLCCDEYEPNRTLFMPALDTLKNIKSKAGNVSVTRLDGTHFSSDGLKFLEQNLYNYSTNRYLGLNPDVCVYSANNPCSETEIAAVNILSLVRDSGYKFGDIGIICSDTDVYERHIERIFEKYDIPYFIDEKKPVTNHPIVKFFLSLLDVYIDDYSFDSIFNYLKASFIKEEPRDICILENFIRNTKIRRSGYLDEEKWSSLAESYFDDDEKSKKTVCTLREKYILPLAKMHEKIKGRHSVKDNMEAMCHLAEKLELSRTVSRMIEKFRAESDIKSAREYEQIHDILIDVIDETVHICADVKISPSDFSDMLRIAFSQNKIGNIPTTADRVIVGNTERTRADGIKVLFTLGVNEGIFPSAPKSDGVLGDGDKEKLSQMGIKFSTTSETAAYYSQYGIYSAFTLPSDRLIISYSKSGNDFKTIRRSYIVSRICTLLSISEISEMAFWSDEANKISSLCVSEEYLCDNVSRYTKTEKAENIWKNVYNYYLENTKFIPVLKKFKDSDNLANRLNKEHLEKLVGMFDHTSVSRIQRYMACRYSYFMDYILNIKPPKDETVDRIDIGNITHYILENLLRDITDWSSQSNQTGDAVISEKTDSMLNEFLNKISFKTDEFTERDKYVIKRIKDSVLICFKAIREQFAKSLYIPLGCEIEFNDNSDLGYIKIETKDGKCVNLTGKIDRADIYKSKDGSFIRVVDYKTGNKTFRLDELFYGLDIQIFVYLNALVSSNSDYRHGGALYFVIDNPLLKSEFSMDEKTAYIKRMEELKMRGMIVNDKTALEGCDEQTAKLQCKHSRDKFELIDRYLKTLLSEVCTDIENGDISINPYKKGKSDPCQYCSYSSVCRFDPTDEHNAYNHLDAISNKSADEIWKKMEVKLNVDTGTEQCD